MLLIAHALDPRVRFTGLSSTSMTMRVLYNALHEFAEKYCPDIMRLGDDTDENMRLELMRNFCVWSRLNASPVHTDGSEENPFNLWKNSLDFDPLSAIRLIAERIFSMPASAADLERVWSSVSLTFSSLRRRLSRGRLLKSLQIKAYMNYEHDGEDKRAHQVSETKKQEISSLRQRVNAAGNQALDSTVPVLRLTLASLLSFLHCTHHLK